MQTITIRGTQGPIYRAVIRLIGVWVKKWEMEQAPGHGLPEYLSIACGRGNTIVVTGPWQMCQALKLTLDNSEFDWGTDSPSSCVVTVVA